ncbi:DUF2767 domain-containing protein [Enterobacter huaxiensis]|uniref:DUF2767 domain-containing protein n=1 Tax=Enterobacter huaxiensis TaxID=2494702 RepID=UPI002175B955|nr:DUF2767 domain-containing protein [Enterobacter huaxiensis]MCS5452327.1 DUF2767 domain-containing protein [Enterobacter huaxiensis]
MSDCSNIEDTSGILYDEACRLTGLCCLMLVSHGAEIDRASLIFELERLQWLIQLDTGLPHKGIALAIELLEARPSYPLDIPG